MAVLTQRVAATWGSGALLIVANDSQLSEAVERSLGKTLEPSATGTAGGALRIIATRRVGFVAGIVDAHLPDGSGLQVLEALKNASPNIPALVLSTAVEHAVISHAQRLGAQFLLKPMLAENLRAFLERARSSQSSPGSILDGRVRALAELHGLSKRERAIISLIARGVPPAQVHLRLGVRRNTTKSLTRGALRKCGARSLAEVVRPLQQEIFAAAFRPPAIDVDPSSGSVEDGPPSMVLPHR